MNDSGADDARETLWATQSEELRDPAEIVGFPQLMAAPDQRLLTCTVTGRWWETISELGITLLVSREYEHLLLALSHVGSDPPAISWLRLPHPSGITVDRFRGVVHVAATRNPNQLYDLVPVSECISRVDLPWDWDTDNLLMPVRTRFLPGCFYLHDLAMVGGVLHGNAVGQNAVVRFYESGIAERAWWPQCIEKPDGPVFGQNHLQLNSIAAGSCVETSFYSASTDELTDIRPGDPAFPVDGRGVIFAGSSRNVMARGLTRPHSARMFESRVWVDNSGYGEVGYIEDGGLRAVCRLPGWTRGLCFCDDFMFVGTSRILRRFRNYAPGLDPDEGVCGVHAVDVRSGEVMGSITWPFGSQIFSIEWVPATFASGLPFRSETGASTDREKRIFYSFKIPGVQED